MESAPQVSRSPKAKSAVGRVLAIDYGRKRIGLAISDELGLTARPLTILGHTNRRNDLRRIRLLAREQQVRFVVVGLPLRLDGRTGEMALEVKRFAARLGKELGLPVDFGDERLTSREADEISTSKRAIKIGSRASSRTAGRKSARDDVAAAIILRDYLALHQSHRPAGRPRVKS